MKFTGKTLNVKLLAFFLCLCVVCTTMSGSALAAEATEELCTCGSPNGEHLEDCPLYETPKGESGETDGEGTNAENTDGKNADGAQATIPECTCGSPDGTHEETCPLYEKPDGAGDGNSGAADDEGEAPECTCGSTDGTHAEDCPLYKAPEADGGANEPGGGEAPECTCGSTDGTHAEDCPLYQEPDEEGNDANKDGDAPDAPECTCAAKDGIHEESCPLYKEADDEQTPECTCEGLDGVHEEGCPLYQLYGITPYGQEETEYVIRSGLMPNGQPGQEYRLLESATVSPQKDGDGNQVLLRVSSVTSTDAEWVWDNSDTISPQKAGVVFTIHYQAYVQPEGEEERVLAEYDFLLSIGDDTSIGDVLEGDYAYISSAVMKADSSTDSGYAVSTGTAPWDTEEEEGAPGVDQRANDNVLRSFDVASYTVEINNRVREDSPYSFYKSGTLCFEFVLPFEKDEAMFEVSSMGWLQSKKDADYAIYQDSTYNGQECQVLRGSFLWEPSGENPAAIGAGMLELNIAIRALALQNGATVQPYFTFWMEGNEVPQTGLVTGSDAVCEKHKETEYKTVAGQEITITAVPRYNVKLLWDGSTTHQKLGTFDFNSEDEGAPNWGLGMVEGRMVTFGMEIHMQGKSAEHGLRGLEIPQGDITFDLELSSSYRPDSGGLVGTTENYPVLLWSVDENTSTKTANNGRLLYAPSPFSSNSAWYKATGEGIHQQYNSCYDGGSWSGTADGNIVHITVSDYQVDLTKLPYACASQQPSGAWYYSFKTVGNDYWKIQTACLSTGRCTVVQPFVYGGKSAVEEFGAGQFKTMARDMNLMAVSQSGQSLPNDAGTGNQAITGDDDVAIAMRLDASQGNFIQRIRYMQYGDVNSPLTSGCSETGKDWITTGSHLTIADTINIMQIEDMTGVAALDQLVKFDDRFFELEKCATSSQNSNVVPSILYGAKPDQTGWNHKGLEPSEEGYDDEMKNTTTDQLIFFPSLQALKDAGYVCVAVLTEWRGGTSTEFLVGTYLRGSCKADPELAGSVFMVTHECRGWNKASLAAAVAEHREKDPMGLENADYRAYFEGGQFPSHKDGKLHSYSEYPDPTWQYEPENKSGLRNYVKAVYNEGGWVDGSEGSYYGDSCRVISAATEISQKCAQTTSQGNEKTAYDMDTNQRIVDFVLYPSLVRTDTGAADTDAEDIVTNVYVECELPPQLKYIPNSAFVGGTYVQTGEGKQGTVNGGTRQSPESYENEEGNTVLRWVFEDQTAVHTQNRTDLEPIYFSCDIGNPGGADDVENNTTLTIQSKIYCDQDSFRDFKAAFQNVADTGIVVTGNHAASMSKVADHTVVNPEDKMGFTIHVGNNSGDSMAVLAIDSLPYKGDSAGSSFDGDCYVSELTMNQEGIASGISLYYTEEESQRGKTSVEYSSDEFTSGDIWEQLTVDSASGTVSIPGGDFKPVAIAAVGNLPGNQTLTLHITLQFPKGQAGDYVANRLTNGGMESYARVYIASRVLEGKTWLDANRDGLQDKTEEKVSGIRVTLMKLKENGDPSKLSDYEKAKGDNGEFISVLTGKTMDVHSMTVSDYSQGRYRFTNLPEGTYGVLFEGSNDYSIADATASPVGAGSNKEIDSDAYPAYDEDGSLLYAFESGIVMPPNDKITTTVYTSANHDLGIYPSVYELKLSKNVDGTMGDRNREFEFCISLMDAEKNPVTADYPYVLGTAQDETAQSGTLEFLDGEAKVKLKHGQSITIQGLARHSRYEVSETNADKAGYEVSWSPEQDRVCEDLTEDKQLVCTNTLNTAIPTGIRMDFRPWLLCVMGAAAAAAAWFLVPQKGKRRGRKKKSKRCKGLTALLAVCLLLRAGQEVSAAEPAALEAAVALSVENEVEGDVSSGQENFIFVLTPGRQDIPMPQDGGSRISICGSGHADFGTIVYTEPGNYAYTISQEKGTDPLYRYDETVYCVTVQVVTDDAAQLHAAVFIEKAEADGKAAGAVFTNYYKKQEEETESTTEPETETETGTDPGDERAPESEEKGGESGSQEEGGAQNLSGGGAKLAQQQPSMEGGPQQTEVNARPSTGDDSGLRILKNITLLLAAAWTVWRIGKGRNRQEN